MVQNVDVGERAAAAEERGVDREEEAKAFDLIVVDVAAARLLRGAADRELARLTDVALLLREDRLKTERTELIRDLEAVVSGRQVGRQKSRWRGRERHVADVDALPSRPRGALVVQRQRVGRVELALHVVVDVHVPAVGDDAGALDADGRLERPGQEAGVAAGDGARLDGLERGAHEVLVALLLALDAKIELERQLEAGDGRRSGGWWTPDGVGICRRPSGQDGYGRRLRSRRWTPGESSGERDQNGSRRRIQGSHQTLTVG